MGGRNGAVSTEAQANGLRVRHERVMREIPGWLSRHRASHQFLAERVGVCRSTLTKFLDDYAGFRPTPERPAKVRLLEELETLLDMSDLVRELPLQPPDLDEPDDAYTVAHHHAERLRFLASHFDGPAGLRMVGELCGHALWGPPGYRAGMAARTILRIAGLVTRPDCDRASPALLRHTVERVERLHAVVHESADDALKADTRRHARHRADGYAGIALATCGARLGDDALVERGCDLALAAVAADHVPEDGHWPNLFRLADMLLAREHALGRSFAARVARQLFETDDPRPIAVLGERVYPALSATLPAVAPSSADPRRAEA